MKNKFLEKIAKFRTPGEVWEVLERRVPNHAWKPGLVGAGIGATIGAIPGETEEFNNGKFVKRFGGYCIRYFWMILINLL